MLAEELTMKNRNIVAALVLIFLGLPAYAHEGPVGAVDHALAKVEMRLAIRGQVPREFSENIRELRIQNGGSPGAYQVELLANMQSARNQEVGLNLLVLNGKFPTPSSGYLSQQTIVKEWKLVSIEKRYGTQDRESGLDASQIHHILVYLEENATRSEIRPYFENLQSLKIVVRPTENGSPIARVELTNSKDGNSIVLEYSRETGQVNR